MSHSLKDLATSNLYAEYSGILSLSNNAMALVDVDGEILLEFSPSSDFCTYICRKDPAKICSDCAQRVSQNKMGRFVCQYGLENTIEPIVVSGKTLGYIIGIQAFSVETEHQKFLIDIPELARQRGLDVDYIAKSLAALKTAEEKQIDTHHQLCDYVAKSIAVTLSERYHWQKPELARLSMEKELLEKKIIDLEAKNMSLVINPHFLFNTLNTIARIAYFEGSNETEELIYCLSDLLRYNIRQENQLHTLESETDNIKKYLYIQKMRFKNRLNYEIDVPSELYPYRMPNMVLQPIVENAVLHGITSRRDGGTVKIQAERYKGTIYIDVIDDGQGFDPEVLKSLEETDSQLGLGFRSTDQRLKKYFGECYGLKVTKSDYSGSTVQITIPTQPAVG